MAFIHYDEQNVTNWKQGEWRFIEYLNGQLVGQYDAIIHNNENMIKLRKNSQPFLLNVKIWLWKTAIVSDEASHNDFWRGEGSLGVAKRLLPGCFPPHFGWSPTAETLSDTSLCMLQTLQNFAARKSRGVPAWSLAQWTKLLQLLNWPLPVTGGLNYQRSWKGGNHSSEWVAITLSKQKKASQCRVQTIWYNLISFFTTSLRLLLFQNLVGSSCWK